MLHVRLGSIANFCLFCGCAPLAVGRHCRVISATHWLCYHLLPTHYIGSQVNGVYNVGNMCINYSPDVTSHTPGGQDYTTTGSDPVYPPYRPGVVSVTGNNFLFDNK